MHFVQTKVTWHAFPFSIFANHFLCKLHARQVVRIHVATWPGRVYRRGVQGHLRSIWPEEIHSVLLKCRVLFFWWPNTPQLPPVQDYTLFNFRLDKWICEKEKRYTQKVQLRPTGCFIPKVLSSLNLAFICDSALILTGRSPMNVWELNLAIPF